MSTCKHTEPGCGDGNVECPACTALCANCGHAKYWHHEHAIAPGHYGEGGYCGWWKDPMFSATEECRQCPGFVETRRS